MTKVVNDLLGYYDMKIVQETDWFNFSLDAVLLSQFVTINKGVKNILDLGTGNAPIPLFLSKRTDANIIGVDIQEDCCKLAKESIELNNLGHQITVLNEDINNLRKHFSDEYFDVIVTNPPYFEVMDNSRLNVNDHKAIARHEISINLSQLIGIASYLLNNKGVFAMVHRTERLSEIIRILEDNKLTVKRIL